MTAFTRALSAVLAIDHGRTFLRVLAAVLSWLIEKCTLQRLRLSGSEGATNARSRSRPLCRSCSLPAPLRMIAFVNVVNSVEDMNKATTALPSVTGQAALCRAVFTGAVVDWRRCFPWHWAYDS